MGGALGECAQTYHPGIAAPAQADRHLCQGRHARQQHHPHLQRAGHPRAGRGRRDGHQRRRGVLPNLHTASLQRGVPRRARRLPSGEPALLDDARGQGRRRLRDANPHPRACCARVHQHPRRGRPRRGRGGALHPEPGAGLPNSSFRDRLAKPAVPLGVQQEFPEADGPHAQGGNQARPPGPATDAAQEHR